MNDLMGINPSKGNQGTGQKVQGEGHFEMWWLKNT